jgi:diguanylate cyclase (GGDEF)-like protein
VNIVKGDSDHLVFSAFVCALIVATLLMLRHLYDQTVRMLCTIEDNDLLVKQVRQINLQLEGIATTDALTGIGNRRLFDDVLSKEILRVRDDTNELSVLMLDVDIFKGFNDNFGHQAGDGCLRKIAAALSATLRAPDVMTRYGGEEFAAILPQTNAAGAAILAEKMRARIEALAIPSVTGPVTVSIGVATFAARQRGSPTITFVPPIRHSTWLKPPDATAYEWRPRRSGDRLTDDSIRAGTARIARRYLTRPNGPPASPA